MAGGVGYSGVGEAPDYGNYGTGGYNPYMLPYQGGGTGQTGTGTGQTGTGQTQTDYTNPAIDPSAAAVMAYGGQVPKMQDGGDCSRV